MCTPASFFVLLLATLCVSIMYGNQMVTDGFPLSRRERGTEDYEDIIAGNDFLSVFLESTLNRMKKETTTASEEPIDLFEDVISTESYLRETREATEYFEEVPQSTERQSINNNFNNNNSSNVSNNNNNNNNDGVIIAVHVSSSVGSSPLINNNNHYEKNIQNINKDATNTHQRVFDQNFLTSDDQPNNLLLVANSGKSELNVEEPIPHVITTKTNNNNEGNINNNLEINKLPSASSTQHIEFDSAEFNGKIINNNNKDVPSSSSPFHHSLIYHDNPRQSKSGQARSVSYSTIIQDIQPSNGEKSSASSSTAIHQHERKERHYNTGNGYRNIFNQNAGAASEKRQEFFTTISSSSTSTTSTTPTPSVGVLKPFHHKPRRVQNIYGRPEQNYEVDEALSVVTNGRTHGIQQLKSASTEKPSSSGGEPSSGADQKDQKVGYVVEGRNYRKYRVEARTPDGFIVGEYGVVSHDDGSLRGVRYTADGTINPRLIYDALMKFLQL